MPYTHIPRFMRPWFLPALAVLTVVSLFAAVLGIMRSGEIAAQRNQDRIDADYVSCISGNRLRMQVRELGGATKQLTQDILAASAEGRPDAYERFMVRLTPVYERFDAAVDAIQLRDCEAIRKAA